MSDVFSSPVDLSGLRDKVVLVTGGASGLGRATAFAMAETGARVVVVDVDGAGAEAVAAGVGGLAVTADVSSFEANLAMVDFALEQCGGLDFALLNAGVSTGCSMFDDFSVEAYRRAMGVNLDGVVFGAHACLGPMRARGVGAVVATASLAGLTGMPMDPIYTANKHGVVGLTRALGPVLEGSGVRFNA